MATVRLVGLSALASVTVCAAAARADDISAKKVSIKDELQVQVQSRDAGVAYGEADNPGASGASIHVYSATDDFCLVLPSGVDWKNTGSLWKYKDKATKNSAQIGDGKLKVKVKSGITFTLADDGTQGTVNAQVQFGTGGIRYCMKCTTPIQDDDVKFIAKECAMGVCDAEPSACDPPGTTTTTSTTTITATTTTTIAVSCEQGAVYPTCGGFCPAGQICSPILGVVPGIGSQSGCGCSATPCSCAGRVCPPSEVCVVQFNLDFSCDSADCAVGPTTTTLPDPPDTGCCQGENLMACATGTIEDECVSSGRFFYPAEPGDLVCSALGAGGVCTAFPSPVRSVCCLVPFFGAPACSAVSTPAECPVGLGAILGGYGSCDADGSCIPIPCGSSGQACLVNAECCSGECGPNPVNTCQ